MDIEIHGSVKEIGVSRPQEFGRKIINLKNCSFIKIYPRGKEHSEEFMDIEIIKNLKKQKHLPKHFRIKTTYKLRGGRPFRIRPEVSNSIYIESLEFDED